MKNETKQHNKIIAWLEKHGFVAVKMPGTVFMRGLPDILAIRNGRVWFFEVKTSKGKLSLLQKVWLEKLAKFGARCSVVRSVEEVIEIVASFADEHASFETHPIRGME